MIHRIIALIIKELQEQFSTRRGVMVLIVPILMQTLLFPFVATQDVTHCEVVVLCDDTGAPATELMQRFAGAPYITEVKRAYSVKEMTDALDSQQCMVGVHIPSDFSRCLARGESAPLQVVCDGLRSNSSQIAAGYITSIASGLAEQNGSRLGGPTLPMVYSGLPFWHAGHDNQHEHILHGIGERAGSWHLRTALRYSAGGSGIAHRQNGACHIDFAGAMLYHPACCHVRFRVALAWLRGGFIYSSGYLLPFAYRNRIRHFSFL